MAYKIGKICYYIHSLKVVRKGAILQMNTEINTKYDFTSIIDRRGMDALAVDSLGKLPGMSPDAPKEGFDVIPMWVADMNFQTAPSVVDAMRKRLDHSMFGYYPVREEYYEKIIDWHVSRNQVEGLTKEAIGYENGVLGGVVSVLNTFLNPGEKVLLHSPTYIGFTNSITNAGFEIVHSPLKKDDNNVWRMDYGDMDKKIKENGIKVAVFCNPHNPCGRVWTKEEMEKAMEVYSKNDCVVVCDEIWSDLILNGNKHIPFQSVNEEARNRIVALYAPSKTFNLSGLVGSYHIIYNPELREKVVQTSSKCHYNDMNVLSMYALIGAYNEDGKEWVDELKKVLSNNINYAFEQLKKCPGIATAKPEGTYMMFIDCEKWCKDNGKSLDELLKAGWDVGVAWQDGRPFHGEYAIRLNLALPFSRVKEAFDRLDKYVLN